MSSITCVVCNVGFNTVVDCAKHIYDEHEVIINCDCCAGELDPSECAPADPLRIYCSQCSEKSGEDNIPTALPVNPNSEILIRQKTLRPFARRSTSKAKEQCKYACEVCDATYVNKSKLAEHRLSNKHIRNQALANGESLPELQCSKCDKVFLTEDTREQHFKRVHADDAGVSCHLCGKKYATIGGYRQHLKAHFNHRSFVCEECGQAFFSRSDLVNHQEWKHTLGLPQKCTRCKAAFKHRRQLQQHIMRVHDTLVYKCPVCPSEFTKSSNLKCHMSIKEHGTYRTGGDYLKKAEKPYLVKKPKREVNIEYMSEEDEDDETQDMTTLKSENADTADSSMSNSLTDTPNPNESTSVVVAYNLRVKQQP